jgi:hypothetical protein
VSRFVLCGFFFFKFGQVFKVEWFDEYFVTSRRISVGMVVLIPITVQHLLAEFENYYGRIATAQIE